MKPSIFLKLLPWVVAGAVLGCEKEQPPPPKPQEVILNVRTVDLANAPVEMVRFYINGKKFGITSQDGTFRGKYPAKDGDKLSFNVEPPSGYSVPANIDQSQWTMTVAYPADGRPLQVDFIATLQRPERDFLFMVRTEAPGTTVKVNGALVGKTGAAGDAMLRVTGVPGTAFTATAGPTSFKATFSEEDQVYLLTPTKSGPLGGSDAPAVAAAEPEAAPGGDAPTAAPASQAPPAAPATEAVAAVAPEPPPAVDVAPPPVVAVAPPVERRPTPARDPAPAREPSGDLFAAARPTPRRERRRPARAKPAPVEDPIFDEPPPAPEPVAPPAPEPVAPPPAAEPSGDPLADLLDDPGVPDPIAAPEPTAPSGDPIAELGIKPANTAASRRKKESVQLSDGIMEDDDNIADKNAIRTKVAIGASSGASPATMDRKQIQQRLDQIKGNLARTKVLQKADVDFLAQIDKTHPGYYEANRLLADFYYRLKDYRRQAAALEIATSRGRYKHDPRVLLSLAKSYARSKNYRRALSTMRRVERKMRHLPAGQKADAYRFHAEILEFEFLRQYHDDAKRANVTLVDKAISKWERYQTFSRGSSPGAVAKAQGKIRELGELKSRVEL